MKSKEEQKKLLGEANIRSAYSYREPVNNPSTGEPTRTKQEFKKEVDINEIIARMRRGISPPPWMTSATPRYGDFTDMPASFQEAYAIVEKGEAAFASLPLEFRRELDHNPANLDSAPRELFERFGLLKKPISAEDAPGGAPKASPPSDRLVDDLSSQSRPGSKNAPKKGASDADE